MIEAIIQGISLGFLLSLTIGPVFFSLIQTSIHNGIKAGILMAVGIITSDSLYILLTYLGVSSFDIFKNDLKIWLGFIGGAIMVAFGVATFFKKVESNEEVIAIGTSKKLYKYAIKGFALNGINPFVFIFWLTISGVVHIQQSFRTTELLVYFISILVVVFAMDIIKVFLASSLRNKITTHHQIVLNRLVGCGLLIFGLYLISMTYLNKI